MTQSARSLNRDLQSFASGDQLAVRLDSSGDLSKTVSGLRLNAALIRLIRSILFFQLLR